MLLALIFLFICMTVMEISVLSFVTSEWGIEFTILGILATGIIGAIMARREGIQALAQLQQGLASGKNLGLQLFEGVLILVAGAFLCTPGFITDAIGFMFLLPPVRHAIALGISKQVASQNSKQSGNGPFSNGSNPEGFGGFRTFQFGSFQQRPQRGEATEVLDGDPRAIKSKLDDVVIKDAEFEIKESSKE